MRLVKGKGSPKTGACWMSAAAYYAGEQWTDHPACVDPVIVPLCQRLNDLLPSNAERDRVIGPHLLTPLGTNQGHELSMRRAFMCAGRAVRVFAPLALDAAGWHAAAFKLRAVPEIVDEKTANAANAAYDAYDAAYAAAYAANAAAYAANAAANAAAAHLLRLILDLCAMGEKCEVPQVRSLAGLPQ